MVESRRMVVVKTTSWEVYGAPSCQSVPFLIVQVVSIRPSGNNVHRPLSREGSFSARTGTHSPLRLCTANPELISPLISTPPSMRPPPPAFRTLLTDAGFPRIAATRRFGAALGPSPRGAL